VSMSVLFNLEASLVRCNRFSRSPAVRVNRTASVSILLSAFSVVSSAAASSPAPSQVWRQSRAEDVGPQRFAAGARASSADRVSSSSRSCGGREHVSAIGTRCRSSRLNSQSTFRTGR
jgi:hypothetical protein